VRIDVWRERCAVGSGGSILRFELPNVLSAA